MAGVQDTLPGAEVRRNGDTVGLPHGESDGTLLSNATVQPGDAVAYDGTSISKATEGDVVVGILVNYEVYGASHQGEKIKGDVDANVAVGGSYKGKVSGEVTAGMALGSIDNTNGTDPNDGELGDASLANSNSDGLSARAVEVYTDGDGQDWAEVVF
ncbi:hypothetical protein M199_gp012 [Halogranum tailed virus 1]|uniref:Uncharacterized protein n=1 Tax=Halogranum tailed virus 1 TaxID=1273749 RepID=R4TKZ1_9CAUD|nr:hypothetical protein M199_gp012 [Halogranum tailed virus 1]AGM11342.1 hypothetical protein HGTV1_12 [Halogranum tailed virus 1]